eukprot:184537_1
MLPDRQANPVRVEITKHTTSVSNKVSRSVIFLVVVSIFTLIFMFISNVNLKSNLNSDIMSVICNNPNSLINDSNNIVYKRHDINFGINIINSSKYYKHDDIFNEFDDKILYQVSSEYITEFNGLKIPFAFDCLGRHQGLNAYGHDYYISVPDRWVSCEHNNFLIKTHITHYTPKLPMIDEEYDEHINLYKSIKTSCNNKVNLDKYYYNWVFVEMGARWGTWSYRSVAAYNNMKSCKYISNKQKPKFLSIFYENNPKYCDSIQQPKEINDFKDLLDINVICRAANMDHFINISHYYSDYVKKTYNKQFKIDYIDMDIQGGEFRIFHSKYNMFLNEYVVQIKIGTHGGWDKYNNLKNYFQNELKWIPISINDIGGYEQFGGEIINRYIRNNKDWQGILNNKYYDDTQFGPILSWDGNMIFRNPKFKSIHLV